ncbi:type VI secretion system tube protein Hcp [Spirosoma sp. BT702]|uniref:Type VI secretion system tube protein Hcp n=1 Tax=Spirosoma profusum TaxID=2771354 RepID=A0A927ASU7_9BACT|nr:type VI secretion system tube protein Hcp [Spirosoma profusum]MBD2701805.1 type VI secretion system tube protein Hcp [Spirosoma profusum]
MKTTFTSFLALLLFFVASASFAQGQGAGIYMEITPATGSTATTAGTFKITSLQNSILNQSTIGSGTGGSGGGRVAFQPLTVTKSADKASNAFQYAIMSGAHFSRIRFSYKNAAGDVLYDLYIGTAFISGYSTSAAEVCENGCPGIAETFTINYGEVAIVDRTLTPRRPIEWSQLKNIGKVAFTYEQ